MLRERIPNQNGSMPSRLPQWIKDAKNRDRLLKCIARLRKIVEPNPATPVHLLTLRDAGYRFVNDPGDSVG